MPTMVICEPGACHDGSLTRMLALADAAKDAGADVFKVQFWSNPERLAQRRRATGYYRDAYWRYRVPEDWLEPVRNRCRQNGLTLGMTVYLPEDARVAERFADVLKVASFEAEATDLLDALEPAVTQQRPLVISLGMGARRDRARPWTFYLRCVSAYPAPVEALNLRQLWPDADREVPDGLSDHTDPALTWTGALAVAAGAWIVEAHLRLDDTDPQNPDAPHAMPPLQFREYVRHIRFAERCLGTGFPTSGPLPCEAAMAQFKVRDR